MKISKLEPSRHRKGRWLVFLEDGNLLRVGESDVLSFSLYTGMELSEETLAALQTAAERFSARNKALSWLTARPMSRQEVLRRLADQDVEEQQAAAVCDWLEKLGFINDEQYAHTVAEHYFTRGYGVGRVRAELAHRGVPRQFWDAALELQEDPAQVLDGFVAAKMRGKDPTPQQLKKVSDAILRRGYSWQEASAALRRYGADIEEE